MPARGARRPAAARRLHTVATALTAAAVTVATLAGCGGATAAPRDAGPATPGGRGGSASGSGTAFDADFADGIPPRWEQRGATVEHGDRDPSSWVRLAAAGTPAYVSLSPATIAPRRHRFRFSGRFRVLARAHGQSVGLATVENSAHEHHADLFVDTRTGRCRVDLFSDDTARSPRRCDDGAWHRVTMVGDYGARTYTLRWTLDGVAMPAIRSTGQPVATVHRLWLGDATPAKTNITGWTDVSFALR